MQFERNTGTTPGEMKIFAFCKDCWMNDKISTFTGDESLKFTSYLEFYTWRSLEMD